MDLGLVKGTALALSAWEVGAINRRSRAEALTCASSAVGPLTTVRDRDRPL
jgi:hypothetical protein